MALPVVAVLLAGLLLAGCDDDLGLNLPLCSGSGEGSTGDPIPVTVGATRTDATVGAYGCSYYTFTTGGSAVYATISLLNVDSDLSYELFSGPAFDDATAVQNCDNSPLVSDEVCETPDLAASTPYYLKVIEWDEVDNTYDLSITQP